MIYVLYTIHVVICLFLILVVLLQQGSGADLSVFGGGGTQTAFGARSATNLLHRLTVAGFVGFILTTMAIGLFKSGTSTVMEGVAPDAAQEAPATPRDSSTDAAVPVPDAPAAEESAPVDVDVSQPEPVESSDDGGGS